jgi:hypothetical protein
MTIITSVRTSCFARSIPILLCSLLAAMPLVLLPTFAQAPGPVPGLCALEAERQVQLRTVEGRVDRMLINPYGEVNGLLLGDQIVVKFSSDLSTALIRMVVPGQSVRVFGRNEGHGMLKADVIVNVATGQVVVDSLLDAGRGAQLPSDLSASQLTQLSVQGRIEIVLTGPDGDANGVILNDGSIVQFPSGALRIPLDRGSAFAASGLGTRNAYGTAIEAIQVGSTLSALRQLYGG